MDCCYCGRDGAELMDVYEPTERNTYVKVARVVCASCQREYDAAPWGFPIDRDGTAPAQTWEPAACASGAKPVLR